MTNLTETEKHRVIYKFFPALRGHLLENDDLEAFFSDASQRARNRGWSDSEIEQAAKSGKWKKQRAAANSTTLD